MAVYKDYEIRINLNELVEKMIPVCDVLHPDLREDIDLSSVYAQAEAEIKNYCDKFGVELPK